MADKYDSMGITDLQAEATERGISTASRNASHLRVALRKANAKKGSMSAEARPHTGTEPGAQETTAPENGELIVTHNWVKAQRSPEECVVVEAVARRLALQVSSRMSRTKKGIYEFLEEERNKNKTIRVKRSELDMRKLVATDVPGTESAPAVTFKEEDTQPLDTTNLSKPEPAGKVVNTEKVSEGPKIKIDLWVVANIILACVIVFEVVIGSLLILSLAIGGM